MEGKGPEHGLSYRYQVEHLNTKPEREADSLHTSLSALASLPLALNSPVSTEVPPQLPRNHLGADLLRRGFEDAVRPDDAPWR